MMRRGGHRRNGSYRDYEVGYGRPPQEHQFKKGAPSPNPRGRPKRKGMDAIDLQRHLMAPVNIKINGKERRMPYFEAFIEMTKAKALNGDPRAVQILIQMFK